MENISINKIKHIMLGHLNNIKCSEIKNIMIINYKFKENTINSNEIKAVNKVLKEFYQIYFTSGKGFNGGKHVKKFEENLKNL